MMCRNALKLSFLLGVSQNVLMRDYNEPELQYCNFWWFKTKTNALYLRALSRVRQTLLRNYKKLRYSVKSLHSLSNIHEALSIIESMDPEFTKLSCNFDVCNVINYITKKINLILLPTLNNCHIDNPEICARYFKYPIYTDESLLEDAKYFKNARLPQGIIVPETRHYTNFGEFGYALNKDEYLYSWGAKLKPFEYTDYNSDEDILNNLNTNNCHLYIDCDNTSIIDVLSYAKRLVTDGKNPTLHVFIDNRTNFLWHNVKTFCDIEDIDYISINRIKQQKSVTDIVLSSKLIIDLLTNNVRDAIIFSSDCDFYGLLQVIQQNDFFKDKHIGIAYMPSVTNEDYNNIIYTLPNVTPINIDSIADKYRDEKIIQTCVELLIANSIAKTSPYSWDITKVKRYIETMLGVASADEWVDKYHQNCSIKSLQTGVEVYTSDYILRLTDKNLYNTIEVIKNVQEETNS